MFPEKGDEATEADDQDSSKEEAGSEDESSDDEEGDEKGSEEESDDDSGESRSREGRSDKPNPRDFFDPKKVPKELRPVHRAMQTAFTRKMQGASAVLKKAAAFDELVKLPSFQKWMDGSQNGAAADDDDGEEEESSSRSRGGRDSVRAVIRQEIDRALRPLAEREKERVKGEMTKEFNQFKKDHPDWNLYEDDIRKVLRENPNLTYRQAYRLASEESDVEEEEVEVRRRKKRLGGVGKGSTSSSGDKTPKKPPQSIREAFELSKEQHERSKR